MRVDKDIGEDLIKRGVVDNVKSSCFNVYAHETFQHLVLTYPITMRVWEPYIAAIGNQIPFLEVQLQLTI